MTGINDDLIKARRVATALMGLRRTLRYRYGTPGVAEALRNFFTDEELKQLVDQLKRRGRG